jgi:hypothetical protein
MFRKLTRIGVVGAAVLAAVGLISTNSAFAAPQGTVTLSPTSGTEASTFSMTPPAGAACTGAGTAGYRWSAYIVSAAVDASTLTYTATGPSAVAGQFTSPMYDSAGGSPVTLKNPAASPVGLINGIPTFSFASLVGQAGLVNGAYKVGIVCTFTGGAVEGGHYWESPITISGVTASGFSWAFGSAPAAPVASLVTYDQTSCTASFTAAAAAPPATYTASITPGAIASQTVTPGTNFTFSGLTTGTTYSITVTANNGVGSPVPSNIVSCTPNFAPPPAPSPFTAQSGVGQIVLTWTPAPVPAGATLVNHVITVTPTVAGSPFTVPAGTNTLTVTAGPGSYSFSIVANYSSASGNFPGLPGTAVASSNNAQTLIQDLTVVRPNGALVLTQRCGVYGSAAAYSDNVFGALPALAASPANADPDPVNGYTSFPVGSPFNGQPSLDAAGTTGDPLFPQYPYPVDANGNATANYPTHCGINLGTGKLVTTGPRAGQYFAANGRMAQITVVNTNDVDGGWTLNGRMSTFTRTGGGDSFSGNLLGWDPKVTYDSSPNLDGYDMVVNAGGVRQPQASNSTTGLGDVSNETNTTQALALAKSPAFSAATNTGSLGLAVVDARLRLLIPVTANAGTYTGTLTFTTV